MQFKHALILTAGLLVAQAQAISFISTNLYQVAEDQTVADEQWVAAKLATSKGTHQNDLFVMAEDALVLNGTYEGNVWGSGGSSILLGGDCQRNLRVASKAIRIDGTVKGNVMAIAETVILGTNSTIEGSAKLLGSSIVQEGQINGDVSITAGRIVTLGGIIKGDVEIIAPEILFSRGAHIEGNLTYTGTGKELVPTEGVVDGKLEHAIPQPDPVFSIERLSAHLIWLLAALLAGIPFITLFPMTTAMASQLVRTSPGKCLWTGALCVLTLPMLGGISLSSLLGVPLGLLILGAWAFMGYIGHIIMGLVLGALVLRRKNTSVGHVLLSMIAGLGIIYLASVIPAISWPIWIAVISMGTGSLLLSLVQKRRLMIQVPEELKHLEELKNQNINNEQEDK
jgi:cytoskeletal protein CcmA (bactofilin family)